jgi:hypothetical protein
LFLFFSHFSFSRSCMTLQSNAELLQLNGLHPVGCFLTSLSSF